MRFRAISALLLCLCLSGRLIGAGAAITTVTAGPDVDATDNNDFSRIQMKAKAQGLISRQFWVAPPQHLHYFNTITLPSFLAAMGFATLDAFADFPIEFFLYHPGSNYIENSSAGKQAHKARVELDLLLAENGVAPLHGLCQAMTRCGVGRNVTVIARPSRNP